MRKITTPEEWNRHLAAQQGSGKTVKSYCRGNDLDLSSFYRQRRKHSTNATGDESQAFVPVAALRPQKVSASSLSIQVKDFTLTLDRGYGSDDLEKVLLVLAKVQNVLRPE